jgi:hypothetical protein
LPGIQDNSLPGITPGYFVAAGQAQLATGLACSLTLQPSYSYYKEVRYACEVAYN